MASRQRGAVSSTLAVWLAGWMAAGPAWANGPQAPNDVAVLVVPTESHLEETAARVDFAVRNRVREVPGYELVRLIDVLDRENAEVREKHIAVGELALKNARNAYNELDTVKALQETKKAIDAYEETDLTRHMDELVSAWIMKIASLVANGENKAAQLETQKLLGMAPDAVFSPDYFPPEEITFAEKTRAQVRAGTATLEVKTQPSGAEVYVDGRFRGISPMVVENLAPGEHWVTAKVAGHSLVQQKVPAGEVSLTLGRAPSWPRYAEVLKEISDDPYTSPRDEMAVEFAKWLGVKQIVLVIVDGAPAASQVQLTFARIDAADGHNYAYLQERLAKDANLEENATALTGRLFAADDPRRGGPVSHELKGEGLLTRKNAGYALIGTGGLLLVGSVVSGLQANAQADRFRGMAQTDPAAAGVRSSGRTYALFADLGLIAGLAAAGGGGYLAFWPTESKGGEVVPAAAKKPAEKKAPEKGPVPDAPAGTPKKKKEPEKRRLDEDDLRNY